MAYGDTRISYPLVQPRISQGATGSNIIYSMTVLSGPTTVGEAGMFEFLMEYVDLDFDPQDSYVSHNILANFYLTQDYIDYRGNETRRYYFQGQLYAPPSRQSSYRASFVVSAGWVHVELAGQQFGRTYDPTPYGAFDGTTLTLWNGATFTVLPAGLPHEPNDYAQLTSTGVDRVDYAFTGSGSTFTVSISDAAQQSLGDSLIYNTLDSTGDRPNPDPFSLAPSAARRIWRVDVRGEVYRRRGSYIGNWVFGTPPEPPTTTGGGVNHGGSAIAGSVTGGGLRTAQSRIHQRFVRNGAATGLQGAATAIGGSDAGGTNG